MYKATISFIVYFFLICYPADSQTGQKYRGLILLDSYHVKDSTSLQIFEGMKQYVTDTIVSTEGKTYRSTSAIIEPNTERLELVSFYPNGRPQEMLLIYNDSLVRAHYFTPDGNEKESYIEGPNGPLHCLHFYNELGLNDSSIFLNHMGQVIKAEIYPVENGKADIYPIKIYHFYYLENGLMERMAIYRNETTLLQTIQYFYENNTLQYSITYDKKGKEVSRTTY